jgi:hypothetical protein
MSWIKDNQFAVVLGGVTLVGTVALFFVGSKAGGRYETELANYQTSAGEVSKFERMPLYPNPDNRNGKKKALTDYIAAVDGLQKSFAKFRPEPLKNVPPQQITDTLIAATEEVRTAFGDKTVLPPLFFLGFEGYKDTLAREDATGILNYQIGATRELFLALAAAAPAELNNVHRVPLPEEQGKPYQPKPGSVARALPIELAFTGSEASLRTFLTSLQQSKNHYFVIRTMRIGNEKKTPPLHTDAKFEEPKVDGPETAASDPFGGGFVLPGDDEEPAPEGDAVTEGDAPAPEPEPEPAAPPAANDSSRILAPVLGTEKVQVFLRIDVMQFLPAKKLPQL